MKKLRITLQTIFFALFILSFFMLGKRVAEGAFQYHWFVWLNPFVGLITSFASRHLVFPALIVGGAILLLSIVFGRFFCGMVCPLGTLIDISDTFLIGKMRSEKRTPPAYLHRLKYVFLIVLLVLACFGVILPLFMDPISLLTRGCAIILNPLLHIFQSDGYTAYDRIAAAISNDYIATHTVKQIVFYGIGTTLLLFVVVLGGGFWDQRFWCQYVCPTGAFLGMCSSKTLFRRQVVEEKCSSCKRCVRNCPTHAIDANDFKKTSASECILCGNCIYPEKGCTRFNLLSARSATEVPLDLKRRHLFAGAVGALFFLPFLRSNAMAKHDNSGRLIRPPGAIPEKEFLARCTACAACIKACPTNVIQPCTIEDGMHRLNTPKFVPRIAGCEEKCFRCGLVCPTGALTPLTYEEKRFAKVGTAVIVRDRCLAWSQNKECVVCDEICPYNAIEPIMANTSKGRFKVPIVYENLCLGCGLCEQVCPIDDSSAIVVYKFGENRQSSGRYATGAQKKDILERRSRKSIESTGYSDAAAVPESAPVEPSTPVESQTLPAGFQ